MKCSFPTCQEPSIGYWKPRDRSFWYFPPIERCEHHGPFAGILSRFTLPDRGWRTH